MSNVRDNDNQYPAIRFAGFTDPWVQRKLGDIGETYGGLSGKTKSDFGHGDARFVTYMNVFSNTISSNVDVGKVEIDEKQNKVQRGDVFFTTSSETREEVGMSSVWITEELNVYLNSFSFGYRPTMKFDLYYLAFMLRSPELRKNIILLGQGISRINISKNKLMDIYVPVPAMGEQILLGSLLNNTESLITANQKKGEKLQQLKKLLLQKMFVFGDREVPEIRVQGFHDSWVQRKLGEVVKISAGGDVDKTRLTEHGQYPVLANSLTNSGIVGYYSTYKVKEPAVTVTGRGDVGHAVARHENFTPVVRLLSLKSNEFDANFLANLINETNILVESTGVPQLTAPQLGSYKILYPKLEEQTKIGQLQKTLNNMITANQKKSEKLQEIKKLLLQQMFV